MDSTTRLKHILAPLSRSQLIDVITHTRSPNIAINALLRFLDPQAKSILSFTHLLPDLVSNVFSFFTLNQGARTFTLVSRRFRAIFNERNRPHWRTAPLLLLKSMGDLLKAPPPTLTTVLANAHCLWPEMPFLAGTANIIQKHHRVAVTVTVYDSILPLENLKCRELVLTITGKFVARIPDTLTQSVRQCHLAMDPAKARLERFSKLETLQVNGSFAGKHLTFPASVTKLVLAGGYRNEADLARFPAKLQHLRFMSIVIEASKTFDMRQLSGCAELSTLRVSVRYVAIGAESVSLPKTLTHLTLLCALATRAQKATINVSGCMRLDELVTTTHMLSEVLVGWTHVPHVTVVVEDDTFEVLHALNSVSLKRLTLISRCYCSAQKIIAWLRKRPYGNRRQIIDVFVAERSMREGAQSAEPNKLLRMQDTWHDTLLSTGDKQCGRAVDLDAKHDLSAYTRAAPQPTHCACRVKVLAGSGVIIHSKKGLPSLRSMLTYDYLV